MFLPKILVILLERLLFMIITQVQKSCPSERERDENDNSVWGVSTNNREVASNNILCANASNGNPSDRHAATHPYADNE